jgi:hypothetical protein
LTYCFKLLESSHSRVYIKVLDAGYWGSAFVVVVLYFSGYFCFVSFYIETGSCFVVKGDLNHYLPTLASQVLGLQACAYHTLLKAVC